MCSLTHAHLIQSVEVFGRDDVVRVEVEDVEEEVSELVLLEVGEEGAAGLDGAQLGHVVRKTTVHPSGCNEEKKHVSVGKVETRW